MYLGRPVRAMEKRREKNMIWSRNPQEAMNDGDD